MDLIVVAGPNGSGKSTIIHTEGLDNDEYTYLSVDSISKMLESEFPDETERNDNAWRACEEWRDWLIANGKSFVWETVFSDTRRFEVLQQAQKRGYAITLLFVTTNSPDINVERVKLRVSLGGHNVPEDKIRSRYERTMRLLPEMLLCCQRGRVYDNSYDNTNPFLAIVYEKGVLSLEHDAPPWAVEAFERLENAVVDSDAFKKP